MYWALTCDRARTLHNRFQELVPNAGQSHAVITALIQRSFLPRLFCIVGRSLCLCYASHSRFCESDFQERSRCLAVVVKLALTTGRHVVMATGRVSMLKMGSSRRLQQRPTRTPAMTLFGRRGHFRQEALLQSSRDPL